MTGWGQSFIYDNPPRSATCNSVHGPVCYPLAAFLVRTTLSSVAQGRIPKTYAWVVLLILELNILLWRVHLMGEKERESPHPGQETLSGWEDERRLPPTTTITRTSTQRQTDSPPDRWGPPDLGKPGEWQVTRTPLMWIGAWLMDICRGPKTATGTRDQSQSQSPRMRYVWNKGVMAHRRVSLINGSTHWHTHIYTGTYTHSLIHVLYISSMQSILYSLIPPPVALNGNQAYLKKLYWTFIMVPLLWASVFYPQSLVLYRFLCQVEYTPAIFVLNVLHSSLKHMPLQYDRSYSYRKSMYICIFKKTVINSNKHYTKSGLVRNWEKVSGAAFH